MKRIMWSITRLSFVFDTGTFSVRAIRVIASISYNRVRALYLGDLRRGGLKIREVFEGKLRNIGMNWWSFSLASSVKDSLWVRHRRCL